MNRPYSGLYYGSHFTRELTYKRSLLLYDELHVFDRPAISFGSFGSAGQGSPLRHMPDRLCGTSFRIICHEPLQGLIDDALETVIAADVCDPRFRSEFLKHFFGGEFAWHFLAPDAMYSKDRRAVAGSDVRAMMARLDWSHVDFDFERLKSADPERMFRSGDSESLELELMFFMSKASHVLNNLLVNSVTTPAVPFTDIPAYHDLLLAKYDRVAATEQMELPSGVKLTYLAHTAMDALLTPEVLDRCSVEDIVKYRDQNRALLEDFRIYMREVQQKIECEPATAEFQREVDRLLDLELLPLAKEYRDGISRAWEKLFGSIEVRGAQTAAALAAVCLVEMPFEQLLTVGAATAGAGWLSQSVVDFINERREVRRNNGLSYLLRLSEEVK